MLIEMEVASDLSVERFDTADNFHDFAGDLGLSGAVIRHGKFANQFASILGRPFHGDHAGNLFADGRVQKALEQLDFETGWNHFLQDAFRRREELVHRLAGL